MNAARAVVVAALASAPLAAQQPPPAFEVASVKPNRTANPVTRFQAAPGRYTWTAATLMNLINVAFQRNVHSWPSETVSAWPSRNATLIARKCRLTTIRVKGLGLAPPTTLDEDVSPGFSRLVGTASPGCGNMCRQVLSANAGTPDSLPILFLR